VLLLERGDHLPQEQQNWAPRDLRREAYRSKERWLDAEGNTFAPGVHYCVGATRNTKVYGAALPRLRVEGFGGLVHVDGTSPAWPVSYEDLEPYYCQAEELYAVHGKPAPGPRNR
jgi:choline dehydrogenase-like flavoprotein